MCTLREAVSVHARTSDWNIVTSPDMLTFNHYSRTRCWGTLISPHVKIVQSNNRWGKFLHISRLILRHYLFMWSDHLYLFSLFIHTGDIISAILWDLFSNFCYFFQSSLFGQCIAVFRLLYTYISGLLKAI